MYDIFILVGLLPLWPILVIKVSLLSDYFQILEPHIQEFCKYLSSSTLTALVLIIFVDMATSNPRAFVSYLPSLKDLAEQQPMYFVQMVQIVGAVGNIDKVCGKILIIKIF